MLQHSYRLVDPLLCKRHGIPEAYASSVIARLANLLLGEGE